MMFVFLVTALAPSLCLALGLKVMFELSAQALGAAALGLHFFATCSAVNASTSPPRRPQQRHNLPPFAPRQSIRRTRNSLPSGRWNHRTKNCTARNPAGRCFYRRSRQHYANDWKPIRKPFHGPRSFPVRGGAGRTIVETPQPEFHRARPAGDFGGGLYTWAY